MVVIRRIYELKLNNNNNYEMKTNLEIQDFLGNANINGILKSYRLCWSELVWRSKK